MLSTQHKNTGWHLPGAAVVAAVAGFLMLYGDQAQAQEQCSRYTVARGDTLSQIAARANVPGGFQFLFNANSNILRTPNQVEVGQVLTIPCADGSLPGETTAATAVAVAPATPPVTQRPLRIVTASNYAPFTDEDLPGGGLFTQLVLRSLELGSPDQEVNFFFVNDWGSQIDSLIPSGAVDMIFPWFRPDCTRVENLSPSNAIRCTDFNHSDPFYDAIVSYYALSDGPHAQITSYNDMLGLRICRPESWFTFDLEAEGLVAPEITLIQAPTQQGCWDLLAQNEVDIVTYDALPAEQDYTEAGMADQVALIEGLTSKQTLHVFVGKDNEFANAALPGLNAGLEELRLSGEWFNIVREGIRAAAEE